MNKNKIIILSLLFMSFLNLRAQIGERRNELSVGVTAGANFNSISFDPTIKQSKISGATGGIGLTYTCEKYFNTICALQMEINYTQMGWKEDILNSSDEKLPDTYERKINYIQVPMLARLGWGKEQKGVMFFITAGPQIGYCISTSSKRSSTWTLNSSGVPDRPNNMYAQYNMDIDNKLDYGISGGLGIAINTSIGHFTVEGRYYYGLSDIFNNSKKDVFSRSANGDIIAKIGYYFTILNDK